MRSRIHEEGPDYPYPIAQLSGHWYLVPGPSDTEIRMVFEIEAKHGVLNRLLLTVMLASFAKICGRLLRRWVQIMKGGDQPVPADPDPSNGLINAA